MLSNGATVMISGGSVKAKARVAYGTLSAVHSHGFVDRWTWVAALPFRR